jgi:hypothetical protein
LGTNDDRFERVSVVIFAVLINFFTLSAIRVEFMTWCTNH